MRDSFFFDSCVLIYTLAKGDHRKRRADELIAAGGVISVQVLNEFASVARRKLFMTWEDIAGSSLSLRLLIGHPVPLTLRTHESALGIAQNYGFQIYDCLIIASALEAGCHTLYTEDLQHNQQIEGLQVINPFLAAPTN